MNLNAFCDAKNPREKVDALGAAWILALRAGQTTMLNIAYENVLFLFVFLSVWRKCIVNQLAHFHGVIDRRIVDKMQLRHFA